MNLSSQTIMIDPGDLIIDMPVDESNVSLKIESMRKSGLVQPIVVWLQDLRIIDGFHRASAAKRLQWREVACIVVDCNEEAFWDARIQSAKQHSSISDERLSEWVYQSWFNSPWRSSSVQGDHTVTLGFSAVGLSAQKLEFARFVYDVFMANEDKISGGLPPDDTWSHSDIVLWLQSKADAWGCKLSDAIKILLHALGAGHIFRSSSSLKEFSLPLEKAAIASYFTDRSNSEDVFKEWVRDEIAPPNIVKYKPFDKYRKEKYPSRDFRKPPDAQPGSKLDRLKKLELLKAQCIVSFQHVKDCEGLIQEFPDESLSIIGELILSIEGLISKNNPSVDNDSLLKENALLKREIKDLSNTVSSLRRALNSSKVIDKITTSDLALSSTQLG